MPHQHAFGRRIDPPCKVLIRRRHNRIPARSFLIFAQLCADFRKGFRIQCRNHTRIYRVMNVVNTRFFLILFLNPPRFAGGGSNSTVARINVPIAALQKLDSLRSDDAGIYHLSGNEAFFFHLVTRDCKGLQFLLQIVPLALAQQPFDALLIVNRNITAAFRFFLQFFLQTMQRIAPLLQGFTYLQRRIFFLRLRVEPRFCGIGTLRGKFSLFHIAIVVLKTQGKVLKFIRSPARTRNGMLDITVGEDRFLADGLPCVDTTLLLFFPKQIA